MGLIYDSGDSTSLQSALSENLAAASSVLDALRTSSDRLIAALGTGELSGEGYSAVDALFSQIIAPSVADAKTEIDVIRGELDTYTAEDAKVSHFGALKEDELNAQLAATKSQRDATEHLIEVNHLAANSSAAVPGLADALHAKNSQLAIVLNQLENDVRDLEDRLKALHDFASATKGLFIDSLENLAAATGDVIALLNQLNEPVNGLPLAGTAGRMIDALATRRKILDYLAGGKLTIDAQGRVRWGKRYLYDTTDDFIFRRGKGFNAATGTRIDHYGHPIKAGGTAALKAPVEDFVGWKGASKLAQYGKVAGIAGTALTVGGNAAEYFGDGVQGNDVQDFAVDTGVDLAGAAVAAGAGAAVGSLILPPLGTIVGALAGLVVGVALSPAADAAKDAIKKAYR